MDKSLEGKLKWVMKKWPMYIEKAFKVRDNYLHMLPILEPYRSFRNTPKNEGDHRAKLGSNEKMK